MSEHKVIKNPTTVGARLAVLRGQLGLSRNAVTRAVGLCRSQLYIWEKGKCNPNWPNTQKLADFYKVSPIWLRDGIGPMRTDGSALCVAKAQGRQRVADLLAMTQLPLQAQSIVLNAVDDLIAAMESERS